MPCFIITGHPCAGKTTIANLVKERALQHPLIDRVVLINEESACPDWTKQQCYETPAAEKKSRAALKSAFDRAVTNTTSNTLVILDSLNYIKGFRYELHCVSKAASERHGILWVLNRQDAIEEWNKKKNKTSSSSPAPRQESQLQQQEHQQQSINTTADSVADHETYSYEPKLLQELVQRYEPPDARNRWDKPLYTIDVSPQEEQNTRSRSNISSSNSTTITAQSDVLQRSVYNMHALGETMMAPAGPSAVAVAAGQGVAPLKRPTKSAFQRVQKPPPSAVPSETTSMPMTTPVNTTTEADVYTAQDRAVATTAPAEPLPALPQEEESSLSPPPSSETTKTTNTKLTLAQQIDVILERFLVTVAPLKEGVSTQRHIAGNANALQDLDATTQRLVTAISQAQTMHTGGCGGSLTVVLPPLSKTDVTTGATFSISNYQRPRSLPELRRLRKQYLQWATSHPPEETSTLGIATHFWRFIQTKETK
jgi:protein KTI12